MLQLIDRVDLPRYLLGEIPVDSRQEDLSEAIRQLSPGKCLLERMSPDAAFEYRVIVLDKEIDDFVAWATTYVENLSPITAFVELVATSEVLLRRAVKPLHDRDLSAFAGVVEVEALMRLGSKNGRNALVLPAALRTLSAVMVQTLIAGYAGTMVADVAASWVRVRSEIAPAESDAILDALLPFWGVIFRAYNDGISGDNQALPRAIQRYMSGTVKRDAVWDSFSFGDSVRRVFPELSTGSRESRRRFVSEAIASLARSNQDSETKAAVAGWMVSLISGGEIELWALSAELAEAYPSAPLWFGFFAGGLEDKAGLTAFRGTGARMYRAIRTARDGYDIDAREFFVRRRLPTDEVVDFPTAARNTLVAKLAKEVVGWFPILRERSQRDGVQAEAEGSAPRITGRRAPDPYLAEARQLAAKLLALLSQPERTESQLQIPLGPMDTAKRPRRRR
jgi:hypothetical protein